MYKLLRFSDGICGLKSVEILFVFSFFIIVECLSVIDSFTDCYYFHLHTYDGLLESQVQF